MKLARVCWLALCVGAASAQGVGVFSAQQDVGDVLHAGSARYDAATATYTIMGSGLGVGRAR